MSVLLVAVMLMQPVLILMVVSCVHVTWGTVGMDSLAAVILIVDCIHFKSTFMPLDVDECSGGSNPCDPNAICTNTDGSFTCACTDGFTGHGDSCTGEKTLVYIQCLVYISFHADIDECSADSSVCDSNANCMNVAGRFICNCNQGYTGDGNTCNGKRSSLLFISLYTHVHRH